MKNANVVKIDSKGRITVPYHIRDYLGLREGAQLVLSSNEKKEFKVMPFLEGTSRISLVISDKPGSLAKIVDVFSRHQCDILMSESRTLKRGSLVAWEAVIDVTRCKAPKRLEKDLAASGFVKKMRTDRTKAAG
ncbi:MAG: hypothetical protein HYY37_05750 [Candidatus Aenigmarchaeota archaeon]|nr:hypothetical protein [Candidatus Aenigmarchaeota archaeon]